VDLDGDGLLEAFSIDVVVECWPGAGAVDASMTGSRSEEKDGRVVTGIGYTGVGYATVWLKSGSQSVSPQVAA